MKPDRLSHGIRRKPACRMPLNLMPTESKAPRALAVEKLAPLLETKLEDELLVLSSIVQAMSKGELPSEIWEKLHEAALRDDRLVELAAAYEEICHPRMLRRISNQQQSELLLHAAEFFHQTLEDSEGAISYLERAIHLDPQNKTAFDLLENLLIEVGNGGKLCDLYVSLAGHSAEKEEQQRLLRRAAELAEVFAEDPPKLIVIHEKLFKLDPLDVEARHALEGLYKKTSRWTELARFWEQILSKNGAEGNLEEDPSTRANLVQLYIGDLPQPDRAIGHIEEILRHHPTHVLGREAAHQLLTHKMLGVRAAAALESAYEQTGEHDEVVRILNSLIELARGAQRIEAQRRLGIALLRTGNAEEAFPILEKSLFQDTSSGELRSSYRQAGAQLGRLTDVAKAFLRCAGTARSQELRVRFHLDAGEALLEAGEEKKAIQPLQAAAESEIPEVRLPALRSLLRLTEDLPTRISLLTQLAQAETSEQDRRKTNASLGEALQASGDTAQAIAAWRNALEGETRGRAEEALSTLYEQSGAWRDWIDLLLAQAQREEGEPARAALERAASIRQIQLSDWKGALELWDAIVDRFGRSASTDQARRELFSKLGRYQELIAELVTESAEGSDEVRGARWATIAELRLEHLNEKEGALTACKEALQLAPGEKKALAVAMRLLEQAPRLPAAEGLEAIFRAQAEFWGLIRALEVIGAESSNSSKQLAALAEAVELVASDDPQRALRLTQEGLSLSLREDLEAVQDWLVRLELLSSELGAPGAHADLLLTALGERALSHPVLIDLARRAVASLVEAKRTHDALPLLQRIFEADPRRIDLAPSLDRLLSSQGDTSSRIMLWREVFRHEHEKGAKIEVLRRIAELTEQHGDLLGAIAALEELVDLLPEDYNAINTWIQATRRLDQQEKLVEVLERAIRLFTGDKRRPIREELVQLTSKTGNSRRTLELLRDLLADGEISTHLLAMAEREVTAAGEHSLLLRILKVRMEDPESLEEQVAATERLAALLTGKDASALWKKAAQRRANLGQIDAAKVLYEQALETGDDPDTLRELTELVRTSGDTQTEVSLLLRQLPWSRDAEEEITLLCTLVPILQGQEQLQQFQKAQSEPRFSWSSEQQGRLLLCCTKAFESLPEQRELAFSTYRALLELAPSPENFTALDAMLTTWPHDDLWKKARRWWFSWNAEHSSDPAAILRTWAQAEEEMGDDHASVELYRRSLVLDPDSEVALSHLFPLLLRLDDKEGARKALLAQRLRAQGEKRDQIDLQLATFFLQHLRKFEEALDLLEPLLHQTPTREDLLQLIEFIHTEAHLPEEESALVRAENMLEAAINTAGFSRSVATLERLLTRGGSPERRRAWHQKRIELASSPEESLQAVLEATSETPLEDELWQQAEQFARQLGRPDEVIHAYKTHLDNPKIASLIGQRAIDFYEEWFEEPEGVIGLVEQVLLADVEAQWALDRLKVFYGADERWGDLLSLYERMIKAAHSNEDRLVFLEDAVEIARDFAADDDRAIRYLEHILQLQPHEEAWSAALERLYERTNRFPALIALLEQQILTTPPPAAQALRKRIAELWLDGLQNPITCFQVLQLMLEFDPEDPDALMLLERMLATFQPPTPDTPLPESSLKAYLQAAAILKARYQQANQAEKWIRTLEIELYGASGLVERSTILHQLIALRLDATQDLPGAFKDTSALLTLDPSDTAVLQSLCDLALQTQQSQQLLDLLESFLPTHPNLTPSLLLEAARIAHHQLQNRSLAIQYNQRALLASQEQGSSSLLLTASRELTSLLKQTPGQERTLFEALRTQLEAEQEPTIRAQITVEMAALARGVLNDPSALAQAWELRRADAPLDPDALAGLIDAYKALSQWSNLVAVLQQRAMSLGSPEEQRSDLLWAAKILENQGDLAGSLTIWEQIQTRFGDSEEVSDTILIFLERLNRFQKLSTLLQTQIEHTETPERKARLLRWLGTTQVDQLENPSGAVKSYARSLDLERQSTIALDRLTQLSKEGAVRAEATSALLHHFQQNNDYQGFVTLLTTRLDLAEDDEARVLILLETAVLQEEKLAQIADAFELLRQALTLEPSDLSLAREALRTARSAGLLSEGVAALEQAAKSPRGAPIARDLWLMIAEALRRVDAPRADIAFEAALALKEDPETLQALVDLRRDQQIPTLVDVLLRLAATLQGAPELLLEAGQVALRNSNFDQAISISLDILEKSAKQQAFWPSWEPTTLWAIELLTTGNTQLEPTPRANVLRKALALPLDVSQQLILLRRLATLCDNELGDTEEAIRALQRLLEIAPEDSEALEQMAILFRRIGRRQDLIQTIQRQISLSSSPEQRSTYRLQLADLLRDTGDAETASQILREALEETPEQQEIWENLGELYEATKKLRDLTALLEARAQQLTPQIPTEASRYWAKAATLAEHHLREIPRAIQAHRSAVALGREASLAPLAHLLLENHQYTEAATVLERIVAQSWEPEERASALTNLADAYAAEGRKEEARQTLEQAVPDAPDPAPLQARLINLYREAGDWERLIHWMIMDARSTQEPRMQAARLREAAELLLERRSDPAASAGLLREAAELLPEDVTIQLSLGESLRLANALEEASTVLRKLIDSYGMRRPKERALAHLQLGLTLHTAQNGEAALVELDTASRIDPAHPRILHTLGHLAIELGELDRAQKSLRSLLLLLPRGTRNEHGVSRVEVQISLAEIARRQGDPARADELLESSLTQARENEEDWALLEAYFRTNHLHGPLARSLELRLTTPSNENTISWLRELTSLYLFHLEQPALALERARRALSLQPENPEVRQMAIEAARSANDLISLLNEFNALATEMASTAPTIATELWLESAELSESVSDIQSALEQAEKSATASPDADVLLAIVWPRLEGLLGQTGQDNALIPLLRRRQIFAATHGDTSQQAEVGYRLAARLFSSADSTHEAVEALREALSLDLQIERSAALLHTAIQAHGEDENILRFYEQFSRAHDRTHDLIDALTRLGALPNVGTAPLREAAELTIQIGDEQAADAILREIFQLDQTPSALPDVIWALTTLADRVLTRGDADLSASLKERAAELANPEERRHLLLEVAALARGPLQDTTRAAKIYETLLADSPGDPTLWRPLTVILRSSGEDTRLATLLEQLMLIVDGPTRSDLQRELIDLLLRGRAVSQQEGIQRAITLLQDALADSPGDTLLTTRLAELLERTGDQQQLARLLEQQLDYARSQGTNEEVASLSLRLGQLLEQLEQAPKALDIYHIGLDAEPTHKELLRSILKLIEQREDTSETTEILERLLRVEHGPTAVELALRLAALHETNWNPEGTVLALELGFKAHPDPTLRDQLAEHYKDNSSWEKLAELFTQDAEAQSSTQLRVSSLCKAAEIQQKHLNNPTTSADLLQQALSLTPTDPQVLQALLDVLLTTPTSVNLRRATDAISFSLEHRPQDAHLLRLRGEVFAKSGAFDAALQDLEVSIAKGNREAKSLRKTTLQEAIASSKIPSTLRPWRLRLAALLQEESDTDGARSLLEIANREEPGTPEILQAIIHLERKAQRWDALIAPLKKLAEKSDGSQLTSIAKDLADIANRAGKPAEARSLLERALQATPGESNLRASLRTLYETIGARRELAQLLREDADLLREPGPRFEALLAAARLLLDPQQGDPLLASKILDEARVLRPDDLELALLLAETHTHARRPREALQVLDRVVATQRGRRSKILGQLYLNKARIELSLGERSTALASFNRAFDNDSSNGNLALELGTLALELNDEQAATRAFRAITLMKIVPSAEDGTTSAAKAQAYYQLSLLALGQADRRKARLLAEKAITEDPSLEVARTLRDELAKNS